MGYTVQSVERALQILFELSKSAEGMSLTELAARTGLHKSTVSRLLKTLTKYQFVSQDSITSWYLLGPSALEIAFDFLSDLELRRVALPHMRSLREITAETVNLAILDKREVVYIDRVESRHTLRLTTTIGKRAPAHSTALGKVLLAYSDATVVGQLLRAGPLERCTANTMVDPDTIESELAKVRRAGVAVDDRENQDDVRCVGAPIFDAWGRVIAAISVSGPVSRITPNRIPQLMEEVKRAAQAISTELGYRNNRSGMTAGNRIVPE
ncbi:MAG: IclR family transcriptional regulator [Chloroflexi bacterium]|nr:IclR family transcriptional regulator [Chloroflexota bacterium]